jgi:hypothetical protein
VAQKEEAAKKKEELACSDFFKVNMAPVLQRSGDAWETLREASVRLQNREVGSVVADLELLFASTSQPGLGQAYVMLLQFSTFDLSDVNFANLNLRCDTRNGIPGPCSLAVFVVACQERPVPGLGMPAPSNLFGSTLE